MAYGDSDKQRETSRVIVGILVGVAGGIVLWIVNPLLILAVALLGASYSCLLD